MDANRETIARWLRYGKWAGLWGGVLGTFVHQQLNSTWIYARCPERPLPFVLGFGAFCALISILTGLWSWSVRQSLRRDPDAHVTVQADRFIASMSSAMALIAVLFIALSSAAAWFLQCQR